MTCTGIPDGRRPSSRIAVCTWLSALVLAVGCSAAPDTQSGAGEEVDTAAEACQESPPVIDVSRSLAVTDLPTLEARSACGQMRFSLERVLGQIAATSGAGHPPSAADLYRRIFDTNNTKAGGFVPDGQHCDDETDASGQPVINGFPIDCPRQEGALADIEAHDPFCSGPNCDPYTPIAMTNRFDLAPANGQNCGQYRIVFGKGVHDTPLATAGNPVFTNRLLLIFEAILPNAHPERGLAGCAPVVGFWVALSKENDPEKRAAMLDQLYFSGVPGFSPVIHFDHYTGAVDPTTGVQQSGQLRANQFMNDLGGQMWQLREYNLAKTCTGPHHHHGCTAQVRMVTTKTNPSATLFDETNESPAALAFRDPKNPGGFLYQVPSLARDDLNRIDLSGLSHAFDSAQSTSSPGLLPGAPLQNDTSYNAPGLFDPSGAFAANIQAALTALGSPLTPAEIVRRSQTQACAGCHELSTSTAPFFGGAAGANDLGPSTPGSTRLTWPDAALEPVAGVLVPAFTQTTEMRLVPLDAGVTCDTACTAQPSTCRCAWALSPAMTDVFLPYRKKNMLDYVAAHTH